MPRKSVVVMVPTALVSALPKDVQGEGTVSSIAVSSGRAIVVGRKHAGFAATPEGCVVACGATDRVEPPKVPAAEGDAWELHAQAFISDGSGLTVIDADGQRDHPLAEGSYEVRFLSTRTLTVVRLSLI